MTTLKNMFIVSPAVMASACASVVPVPVSVESNVSTGAETDALPLRPAIASYKVSRADQCVQ